MLQRMQAMRRMEQTRMVRMPGTIIRRVAENTRPTATGTTQDMGEVGTTAIMARMDTGMTMDTATMRRRTSRAISRSGVRSLRR